MIERLCGEVFAMESDYIGVDVQGVGYQVFVINPYQFEAGMEIILYIHHVVREDAMLLYGFSKQEERNLFRSLLAVSGVGPKVALAILSAGAPAQLVSAIQTENVTFLTKLPGIGKKTAGRLVLDLKDKLVNWLPMDKTIITTQKVEQSELELVIDALIGLGYDDKEAKQLAEYSYLEEQKVEDWIRAALRQKGVR
jgi:Holliday junction DNA helicase RuvA